MWPHLYLSYKPWPNILKLLRQSTPPCLHNEQNEFQKGQVLFLEFSPTIRRTLHCIFIFCMCMTLGHFSEHFFPQPPAPEVVMHRRVGSAEPSGRFLTISGFGWFWQRIIELWTVRWSYFLTFWHLLKHTFAKKMLFTAYWCSFINACNCTHWSNEYHEFWGYISSNIYHISDLFFPKKCTTELFGVQYFFVRTNRTHWLSETDPTVRPNRPVGASLVCSILQKVKIYK